MNKIFTISIVLVFLFIYLLQGGFLAEATTTVASNTKDASKQYVINTIQEIGRKISYAQWGKTSPPENVILSPLSIAIILNLLILATNGTTNLEIRQALSYPNDLQENIVHETYQEIFATLPQSGSDIEISLYTRLFVQIGFTILESFTDVSEIFYQSEVESLDFKNSPDASTDRINSWISESTKGKIEKLFLQPLGKDTVCVMVNVIFLNATWENQFDTRATRDGYFYTGTETVTIPMMNRKMYVPYRRFETEGFEMISLPYVGEQLSMYILKPLSTGTLQQIENGLTPDDLNNFITQMEIQYMNVTIPKMKLNFDLNVNADLISFGVNQVFKETADFTRFTSDHDVYVSSIVHKAILEVTEGGTVAAAVTAAVVVGITSVPPPARIFQLNKPSLLYIRDNKKRLTLFWGRVMKPHPLEG